MDVYNYVEDHLLTATILRPRPEATVVGGGGHPAKGVFEISGGFNVFVKFETGVVNGSPMVRNEAAAWGVAKLAGWTEVVPPTVLRDIGSPITGTTGLGSVQLFYPGAQNAPNIACLPTQQVWQAAAFDYIVSQSDRGGQNWIGVTGPVIATSTAGMPVHLKLIDHGYAFGLNGLSTNSVFIDTRRGQELPLDVFRAVERLVALAAGSELPDLLSADALSQMLDRARRLLTEGAIPTGN